MEPRQCTIEHRGAGVAVGVTMMAAEHFIRVLAPNSCCVTVLRACTIEWNSVHAVLLRAPTFAPLPSARKHKSEWSRWSPRWSRRWSREMEVTQDNSNFFSTSSNSTRAQTRLSPHPALI